MPNYSHLVRNLKPKTYILNLHNFDIMWLLLKGVLVTSPRFFFKTRFWRAITYWIFWDMKKSEDMLTCWYVGNYNHKSTKKRIFLNKIFVAKFYWYNKENNFHIRRRFITGELFLIWLWCTNIYTSMTRRLFRGGLIYELDLVETTAMSWRGSSQRMAYVVPKQTLSTFGV